MFQKKIIYYIMLLVLFCSKTYADEIFYSPFIFSLTPSLSLPPNSKNINTNLSLGIWDLEYNNLYGFGFAYLYQESFGDIYGMQASFVNFANHIQYGGQAGFYNRLRWANLAGQAGFVNKAVKMGGAQFGFVNLVDDIHGAQFGFVNLVDNIYGAQVGFVDVVDAIDGLQFGVVNVADAVDGLQIGLVNTTTDVTGIQLGLVNYADHEEGTSIGIISFIRDGTFRIGTQYSSQNAPSIQTEFGGKKVYNVIRYVYSISNRRLEYWIGFGSKFNLYANTLYFYPQIFWAGYLAAQNGFGLTTKFGYLSSEHFEITGGANYLFSKDAHNNSIGFLHQDKYSAEFFLGAQFDFKQSIFETLFNSAPVSPTRSPPG